MQGLGTIVNPYQVTTIAEFRSMNNVTAYYKLMNDIDANTFNNGVWTPCTIAFQQFDMAGNTIRNINYTGGSGNAIQITATLYKDINVNNGTFENCILKPTQPNDLFYISSNKNVNFNNVTFSVDAENTVSSSAIFHSFGGTGIFIFNYCTLSIKMKMQNCGSKLQGRFNRCAIYIDAIDINGTYGSANPLVGNYNVNTPCRVQYSYIRGTYTMLSGASNDSTYYPLIMWGAISSYFAIAFTNVNYAGMGTSNSTTCFYDATIANVPNMYKSTADYALTTAQCKDKAYLNSIGFVVV